MLLSCAFFFDDTATPEIYTLSLHDALPILMFLRPSAAGCSSPPYPARFGPRRSCIRSEEHTSELQSRRDLVCRLLLEKKNTPGNNIYAGSMVWSNVTATKLRALLSLTQDST